MDRYEYLARAYGIELPQPSVKVLRAVIQQLAGALEMARSGAVFKHPQIAVAVADALTAARPYLQEANDDNAS